MSNIRTKKGVELFEQRSAKIKEMEALKLSAETAGKRMSDEQRSTWNTLNGEVEAISDDLKVEERQAELAGQMTVNLGEERELDQMQERFNLSRAMSLRMGNKPMDGVEKEMNDIGAKEFGRSEQSDMAIYLPVGLIRTMRGAQEVHKRATETKTTGIAAGHIPTDIYDLGQNIVVSRSLYEMLGTTVLEGLTQGKLEIPYSDGHGATKLAEGATEVESAPSNGKGTLTASRYQGGKKYSREYLAESVVMPSMMADMIESIDRSVGSDAINQAVAANVMTGFGSADTGAVLTWKTVLDIIAYVNSDNYRKEGFAMSKSVFYKLAATAKESGDARFVLEAATGKNLGQIFGILAAGTTFLPEKTGTKYDIVYGDWSKAFVGFWGGIEMLLDPFSAKKTGEVEISYSRLGDTFANPLAFASKRNVLIA